MGCEVHQVLPLTFIYVLTLLIAISLKSNPPTDSRLVRILKI